MMIYSSTAQEFETMLFEQRLIEDHRRQRDMYRRNWEYYNGDHAVPLAARRGQANDNVIINLARTVVDKGASYLFGKPVEFELVEGDTTPEEEWLQQVWDRNNKNTFLLKLGKSGGIYGHTFIKIVPDGRGVGLPRLVSIEPENMDVFWAPDDIERVMRYRIEWIGAGADGKAVHYRQDIFTDDGARWHIENRIAHSVDRWQPDPDNPDKDWPWSWPPVVDCQNMPLPGAFYGLSDLEDLSEQDALNYVASKIQRILRYHAHPKTWARGVGQGDIKINEDDMLIIPSDRGEIRNLEMQSDLGAALSFFDRLRNLFLKTSRTPDLDPAKVNVGALSGFALRILYGEALEKVNEKRMTYGDMLVELNRRLLDMAGKGEENYCTIHWQDPLPEDEAAEKLRDEFELDYKLASVETVRHRRGIDHEAEEERIVAQEAREGNIGAVMLRAFETGRRE